MDHTTLLILIIVILLFVGGRLVWPGTVVLVWLSPPLRETRPRGPAVADPLDASQAANEKCLANGYPHETCCKGSGGTWDPDKSECASPGPSVAAPSVPSSGAPPPKLPQPSPPSFGRVTMWPSRVSVDQPATFRPLWTRQRTGSTPA